MGPKQSKDNNSDQLSFQILFATHTHTHTQYIYTGLIRVKNETTHVNKQLQLKDDTQTNKTHKVLCLLAPQIAAGEVLR